jgi:hypothetical protein
MAGNPEPLVDLNSWWRPELSDEHVYALYLCSKLHRSALRALIPSDKAGRKALATHIDAIRRLLSGESWG